MSIFNVNICLVDDDPLYSDFLVKSLKNRKYKVTSFASGIDMLDILEREPDLIFIDVQMDNMNGIQTSRILKKKWPRIKVVLISSSECADHLFKQDAKDSFAFEYKSKDLSRILEHARTQGIKKMIKILFLLITSVVVLSGFFCLYLV